MPGNFLGLHSPFEMKVCAHLSLFQCSNRSGAEPNGRNLAEHKMLIMLWSLGGVKAETEGDKLVKKLNAEQSRLRAVSQYPSPWH